MSESLGNHILVELTGCDPEILNSAASIENFMVDAAEKAGATVINSSFHHFSPYGVSGVVVIQESHFAIHTWPEYGYAAVDLFTCGDQVDAWKSFDYLKSKFDAKNYSVLELKRGAISLLERLDFNLKTLREKAKDKVNEKAFQRNVWFTDKDDNQALSLRYTGEILYSKQSEYQKIQIIDTYKYGKALTLDQMVMTTEKDEFHYHEMIAHPACLVHGQVANVLVIGAGDGGTIRELLKHKEIEKITMVEIDADVVEACKLHLPSIANSFEDPRIDLRIEDGIEFIKTASSKEYDLVLVDGSDPVGPAEGLFTVEFYQNCYRVLNDKGILVAQGESPKFNEKAFTELNATIRALFGEDQTKVSLFYVPTYPTGMWSFQWGMKGIIDFNSSRVRARIGAFCKTNELGYYNEHIHHASFALPNFVHQMINSKLLVNA